MPSFPDRPAPNGTTATPGRAAPRRPVPRPRGGCYPYFGGTRRPRPAAPEQQLWAPGIMELARNLKVDSVSRLRPAPALRARPEQPVAEAVQLMKQQGVGCVLVCRGDRLVGIFTERDLLRRVLAPGLPLTVSLGACMTPEPVVVRPKDYVAAAVRHMEEGGYRHLPVVDEAGRPVGVLSVRRIVHYLAEHFPATIYNLPPDPSAYPLRAEGA